MIWEILVVAIAVGFISSGFYMVYAAISGKGIPEPENDALFQIKLQYKFRGIIGVAFMTVGIMIMYGVFN
jgi:uncharacterized membrane protein YkgB